MPRILVTGMSGQVARSLAALDLRGFDFVALGRPQLDLADSASIDRAIAALKPAAVVNAAAYTAVDKAESEPDAAFLTNRDGAGHVAASAARHGLPVVHLSTDYVFDGRKAEPYDEEDAVAPQGVYGRSKLEGENFVRAANPAHVVLRTAWVYSPYGGNFLKTMLRLAGDRPSIRVVADQRGNPTYAPDIAAAIGVVQTRMLQDPSGQDWRGLFHMVAEGETSWAGFATEIFSASAARGGPSANVEPISSAEYPTPATRPANSRLSDRRFRETFGHSLPEWRDGVARCVAVA